MRALLSAGDLDPTFGAGGSIESTQGNSGDELKIDSQDRILSAGGTGGVARYTSHGTLDASFGNGGFARTDFASPFALGGMAIQSDDKILLAGSSGGNVAVVRYDVHGNLDHSFGGTGFVTKDLGGSADHAVEVQVQPNGGIVVAAISTNSTSTTDATPTSTVVLRFNSDGILDESFGNGGIAIYNVVDTSRISNVQHPRSMLIQPDGKIVVAGWNGRGNEDPNTYFSGEESVQVLRYLPDGTLDPAFGNGGVATPPIGRDTHGHNGATATQVGIQPDGRLILSGLYGVQFLPGFNFTNGGFVARLNEDGGLDATFGNNTSLGGGGQVLTSGSFRTKSVVQNNGQILFATQNGLSRLNVDGTNAGLPGAFDINFGDSLALNAVAVDRENHILLSGIKRPFSTNSVYTIRRLDGDSLDPMYRVYLDPSHDGGDQHYFTTNPYEYLSLVHAGWNDETRGNPGFVVHSNPVSGTLPIHMLYNPNDGEHYYTLSDFERDALVSLGWEFHRDQGYIFPKHGGAVPPSGTIEILHLYNQRYGGQHLFTQSPEEAQAILSLFPDTWVLQASLGFANGGNAANAFTPSTSQANGAPLVSQAAAMAAVEMGDPSSSGNSAVSATNAAGIAPTPETLSSVFLAPPSGTTSTAKQTLSDDETDPSDATPRDSSIPGLDQFWSAPESLLNLGIGS